MIRIIRDPQREYQRTCPKCRCEFVYDLAEVRRSDVDADRVKCPSCGYQLVHQAEA